ncbi:MAG: helix-turn-helix domain-containing protein [Chitinivibrionales bacterium]|nr:helix-turn-helix domain-containing protein [Chitinivibrionales bacterium]
MIVEKTPQELEKEIGQQLLDLRLRQNVNQRELASRAGVALNVVKNLEKGKGATVTSLVKVLRTLGRAEWLASLAPAVSISPMQMLKAKHQRQRASKRRGPYHV